MEERLQKILAHAGVASRRAAEKLIAEGRVRVNGQLVREMGVRADPARDEITLDGQKIRLSRKPIYILLNKPRNIMSTLEDPQGRPTVVDILRPHVPERLYPVGRLDFASEGLLILTNDGEFTRFMTQAGAVPKVYRVKVSGIPSGEALDRLRRGIPLDGERSAPCEIELLRADANSWFEVTLRQGRNRQVRRMFDSIGHRVMKLRRTRIGFLEAPQLEPGAWRPLTRAEVDRFYSQYASDSKRASPKPGRGSAPNHGSVARAARQPRAAPSQRLILDSEDQASERRSAPAGARKRGRRGTLRPSRRRTEKSE